MNVTNQVKMTFKSKSTNESFARGVASVFFSALDPTVEELSDIKTAISEAVTNSVVHGYKNCIGNITMTLKVIDNQIAYIKIRDSGCGIPDIKQAVEPLYTTAPDDNRAGLGFAVMESFMDNLRIYSRLEKGTTIVMKKRIERRDE